MSSNIKVQRICQHCNREFTARTTTTLYCSHRCNSAAYKAKQRTEKVEISNKETKLIKSLPIEALKAKEFLTVRDVSTLLNCSIRTVYRLIDQGNIKAVNIAQRKTLVMRTEIDGLFKNPMIRQIADSIHKTPKQDLQRSIQEREFDISECYTLIEVQHKYSISEKALYEVIRRNGIPKIKKGWYAYVPKTIIDNILR